MLQNAGGKRRPLRIFQLLTARFCRIGARGQPDHPDPLSQWSENILDNHKRFQKKLWKGTKISQLRQEMAGWMMAHSTKLSTNNFPWNGHLCPETRIEPNALQTMFGEETPQTRGRKLGRHDQQIQQVMVDNGTVGGPWLPISIYQSCLRVVNVKAKKILWRCLKIKMLQHGNHGIPNWWGWCSPLRRISLPIHCFSLSRSSNSKLRTRTSYKCKNEERTCCIWVMKKKGNKDLQSLPLLPLTNSISPSNIPTSSSLQRTAVVPWLHPRPAGL